MFELLEKAVMTAIGAAALTQKKADELRMEMREKFRFSEEEGKLFIDRIQEMARDSKDRVREMSELEVQKAIDRLGLVSREEFDRLALRVFELENKLRD